MRWGQAERLWEKYEAALAQGRTPAEFLPEVSDESLIQLLLVCPADKRRERDNVATHLWNRLRWSRRTLEEVTGDAARRVEEMTQVLDRAVPVVHRVERIAHAYASPGGDPDDAVAHVGAADASAIIEVVKDVHERVKAAHERLEAFRGKRVGTGRPDEP